MFPRYVAIGLLTIVVASSTAAAQSTTTPNGASRAADGAKALSLSQSAWQAANERNHDKACPMFDEALQLDPNNQNIAIAVAQCYDEAGKYVTAVDRYNKAKLVAANQQVQSVPMLDLINAGITSATNRISYVTIYVPGSVGSIPGISVTLNGKVISPSSYGTQIPLDRGKYQIVTVAPERIPGKIEFEILGDAQDIQRTLVPLEIDPKTRAPTQPVPSTKSQTSPGPAQQPKKDDSKPPVMVDAPPKSPEIENKSSSVPNNGQENDPSPPNPKKNSDAGGGIALILLGGGLITGASFLAKEALDLRDSEKDYSLYGGFSAAAFLTGATSCLIGIALVSSPPTPAEKRSAFLLHSPKIVIGPSQVAFQARW